MSDATFTPGPWEVRDRWYIGRPGRLSLAEVKCGDVPATDEATHEANARLIAAAPDLLAALRGLAAMYTAVFDTSDGGGYMGPKSVQRFEDAHKKAQQAIAKALGN